MKKIAAFLLATVFLFSNASSVLASDIKIEPENFFVQATAGKTVWEVVTIKNLSPATKNLNLAWEGYSLPEGEFTNRVDLDQHSINFASISQQAIELQPFGTAPVDIEFKIPKDTVPADYYGSLSVIDQSSKTQTEFTTRILGKIEEIIDVTGFYYDNSNLYISIANNGNQTINLLVKVTAKSFFGHEISLAPVKQPLKASQHKNLNLGFTNILPGYYQAKISLEYGSGKTKTVFYSFWVHRELFLIGGLLIIVVFGFVAFWFRKRVRK